MDLKDVKISFAKYRITQFDLVIPNRREPYTVHQSNIGNWTIEKDYENDLFPYLEIRVLVPDTVWQDVMDNSENIYVNMRVEYALYDDVTEMSPEETLYGHGTIVEHQFYAFIDNKTPKLTDGMSGEIAKEEFAANEDELTQYSFDNNKPLVMALYRADHLFPTNQIINAVLSGCTATDGMVYILKKLGLKKVLMSPSNNGTKYTQLCIPPIPAAQALFYVANTYNLHTAGTLVFFDYDGIYILDKKLGCTAWYPNEYKTTYIASYTSSGDNAVMKSGYYSNGKEKYSLITVTGNSLSIVNDTMAEEQILGGNIVSINSNTGEVSQLTSNLDVADDTMGKSGTINRVVVINEGSETALSREKAQLEQYQSVINIVVQSVNIRALSPNKEIIFTTDNPKYEKYNGRYRLIRLSAIFTKESTLYDAFVTVTLAGGN